ncbi:MAG: hypothetical protein KAT06_02390 [Gammaproteobacteria bacterium]|nr:hypothetical protein [Gammaproteobacteria bacterium]
MGTYKTKIIDNIICGKIDGELNASLANEWVEKLEEQEASAKETLHRFYDVRDINAIHLSFDDLWAIAQRRLDTYQAGDENLSAFWVSTPLNYGVARMYQALTDGTPFKIEVLYKLEEVADFLGVDIELLENVSY